MSRRILICTSTASQITNFHLPYIQILAQNGYRIDTLSDDKVFSDFITENYTTSFDNKLSTYFKTIWEISKIFKSNKYTLINVHTPLLATICRLALLITPKNNTKLIYTSNGYPFTAYSKPVYFLLILWECLLSSLTDAIITNNKTDYKLARHYKLCKRIYRSTGLGLNLKKYTMYSAEYVTQVREMFSHTDTGKIFLCVGEFSKFNNQSMIIKCFDDIISVYPDTILIFAGNGKYFDECKELAISLKIDKSIKFVGKQENLSIFYQISDFVISSSRCEGLPLNIAEALYFGKPIVASHIKGNIDLLDGINRCMMFNLNSKANLKMTVATIYKLGYHPSIKLQSEYLLRNCMNTNLRVFKDVLGGF